MTPAGKKSGMSDMFDGQRTEEGLTYLEALTELRELVDRLAGEQDIDMLAKEVSRAKFLISFCRSRITNAELEISQILSDELPEDPF